MIEFISANWVWIVFVVAMIAMHRGGGCGSHGNHREHRQTDRSPVAGDPEHGAHR